MQRGKVRDSSSIVSRAPSSCFDVVSGQGVGVGPGDGAGCGAPAVPASGLAVLVMKGGNAIGSLMQTWTLTREIDVHHAGLDLMEDAAKDGCLTRRIGPQAW